MTRVPSDVSPRPDGHESSTVKLLSRRTALGLFGGAGAALALGPVLDRGVVLAAENVKKGGQVVVALSQEPTVFNPVRPHIEVDHGVHFGIFDSLWKVDERAQFIPNLATEVPSVRNGGIQKSGLEYVIKLKRGVKWHDGQSFTARDVKFTHDLILNPKFGAYTKIGHDVVSSVEIVDEYTIRVRLKESFAPFLTSWGDTYIVPAHILEGVADPNTADFNTKSPVGTGPFKFASRVAGDHLVLKANEGYHGAPPTLERVIFKYIPDLTVLYTQFKTGAVDVTGLQGISAEFFAEAKGLPGVTIHQHATPSVEYIYFNHGKPQFKEVAVRQALYAAVDKKAIIDQIYYGIHKPVEGYLPATAWAYNADLPKQEYNPEKAKQILEESGWKVGPDGIRAKNGVRLAFTNSTTAGNKLREQTQALIQQNWKAIGVDMQINNMPAAVVWGEYYVKSKYETLLVGIQAIIGDDPDCLNRIHSKYIPAETGSGRNVMQYKNPQVDKLLEDGVREVDRAKRRPIYLKLQEVIRADLPYLPLFSYVRLEGVKQGLVNYKPNSNTLVNSWNMNEWGWKT
jgi:peptide/nickel transport system substrate-binding protein